MRKRKERGVWECSKSYWPYTLLGLFFGPVVGYFMAWFFVKHIDEEAASKVALGAASLWGLIVGAFLLLALIFSFFI